MKNLLLFCLLFQSIILFAQNQLPQITNLNFTLNDDESLTIEYDLSDFENDDVIISLHMRKNDETNFLINTEDATGDLGLVSPTTGKTIEWNYAEILNTTDDYVIKLVADDMQSIDIQNIANQVDSNNLKTDLALIEGIRHRSTGAVHLDEVRDLINQRFLDLGLDAEIQDFDFGTYVGKNHIGTQSGTTDDEFIYICDGHYDGVSNSPAADDNGSGVAGMLEAARILSNYNFKKTIKFIGFDLEEAGLKGSEAYVLNNIPVEEEVMGVLNFEMIGYYSEVANSQSFPFGFNLLFPDIYTAIEMDSFRGNFITNVGVVNQNEWELAFEDAATTYVPNLKVVTIVAPQNWLTLTPDLARSDHAPFWFTNRPAVMLSTTANFRHPDYHAPGDTSGVLNFTFMSDVVKAAIATLAEEAEVQHSSVVEETINITVSGVHETQPCQANISPNPVRDFLHLKWTNCTESPSFIRIYDLSGKMIFERNNLFAGTSIDVKNWEKGVYLLETDLFNQRFLVQ